MSIVTVVLLVVAGLAVGAAGAMGLRASGLVRPHAAPVAAINTAASARGLTPAETGKCEAAATTEGKRARALYGSNTVGESLPLPLPSRRQAVAEAGALIDCLATTRPEHFCDPASRQAMVTAVQGYVSRADELWGLTEQGMAMATSGWQVNPTMVVTTLGLSQGIVTSYNRKLGERVGGLVQAGYFTPGDFGGVFGVSGTLGKILGDAKPGASPCA